ncbi:MotA/TolQ/ExbB proton channel family protein [Nocardioides sp. WV_118_6]
MKDQLYETIFRASEALEIPVVVLALASLAWVVVELGSFAAETARRLQRRLPALVQAADRARGALDAGDRDAMAQALRAVAWSPAMGAVLASFARDAGTPGAEARMAKQLADFDFGRQRRLGRTRLLVRTGPALGLMGTLIPLSPALEGLAAGDIAALSDNLRLAFSITVLGLLVGAGAFAISLARDRIYGQDFSDLEYVAAILTAPADQTTPADPATPAEERVR